jgi:hypothetical protein
MEIKQPLGTRHNALDCKTMLGVDGLLCEIARVELPLPVGEVFQLPDRLRNRRHVQISGHMQHIREEACTTSLGFGV